MYLNQTYPLKANSSKLCSDSYSGFPTLIVQNNAVKLLKAENTVATWDELKNIKEFVDSANSIVETIQQGDSLEIFNNGVFDIIGNVVPDEKKLVRAVFIYIDYPCNINGAPIQMNQKRASIQITDAFGNSMMIPMMRFWSWIGNVMINEKTEILESVTIHNNNSFPIEVRAFLVKADSIENKPIGGNCP